MKVTFYTKEKGTIETTFPVSDKIEGLTWHRDDGPAIIRYYENGTIYREEYWVNGVNHRTDGPADIKYHEDGTISYEDYWVDGVNHRTDGPAEIGYYRDGNIHWEKYWVDDKLHRTDGPAFIKYNINGTISREVYLVNGANITNQVEQWLKQKNITVPLTDKEQYEFTLRFS